MTKLWNPKVLGKGIKIDEAPTDPKHAVRKVDLESFVRASRYELTGVQNFTIQKVTNDFIVQFYDEANELFLPNSVTDTDDGIEIEFLKPQTGVAVVLFIGGGSGN